MISERCPYIRTIYTNVSASLPSFNSEIFSHLEEFSLVEAPLTRKQMAILSRLPRVKKVGWQYFEHEKSDELVLFKPSAFSQLETLQGGEITPSFTQTIQFADFQLTRLTHLEGRILPDNVEAFFRIFVGHLPVLQILKVDAMKGVPVQKLVHLGDFHTLIMLTISYGSDIIIDDSIMINIIQGLGQLRRLYVKPRHGPRAMHVMTLSALYATVYNCSLLEEIGLPVNATNVPCFKLPASTGSTSRRRVIRVDFPESPANSAEELLAWFHTLCIVLNIQLQPMGSAKSQFSQRIEDGYSVVWVKLFTLLRGSNGNVVDQVT
jgi:hypothetical protein